MQCSTAAFLTRAAFIKDDQSRFLYRLDLPVAVATNPSPSAPAGAPRCPIAFAISLYLLSKGRLDKSSLLDWLCSASAVLIACFGFTGCSITLFAFYLFIRDRHDLNTRAAGTVAAAVATQAVGHR